MCSFKASATKPLLVFLTVIFFLCPCSVRGEDSDSSGPKLYFQNQQVDPLKESLSGTLLPSDKASPPSEKSDASSPATSFARTFKRLFSFSAPTDVVEYNYYVVQFIGPVQSSWKKSLAGFGAVFFDYIPQYAFIIKLGTAKVDDVKELEFVRWIGEYAADLKLSRDVYDITPDKLREQEAMLKVRVVAFPGEDMVLLGSKISSAGGTVLSSSSSEWRILINVKISIKNVDGLKDIKGVKWIERASELRTDNNIALGIIEARSEQEKVWPVSRSKLFGEGQIVAICDSGIDTGEVSSIHEDFSDGQGGSRINSNVVFPGSSIIDYSGHGTHVAGTVLGNGMKSGSSPLANSFPSTCYAGAAPKARLYFQTVGPADGGANLPGIPADLFDIFDPAHDAGARIHSNSWGASGPGNYDSLSVSVDQFMWSNKDFLILFAAGNAGKDKDLDGVIDSYCIDSPGTAKNCLTVGASESYRIGSSEGYGSQGWNIFNFYAEPLASDLISNKPYGLAAFSSRGPTIDGRYKPEIVAPGTNILSTRSSNQLGNGWGFFNEDYYWSGGTSMATPLVAGTAAVLREYLIKEEGFTDPSAALVKTSLIHGAGSLVPGQYGTGSTQEVSGAPDNVQGWGRMNLESSINSDDKYETEYHDIEDFAPSDTTYSRVFSFKVENNEKPFKAVLGWTDYPGSVAASGGLVNDLDLRVQQPDGTWVYPDNAVSLSPLTKYLYATAIDGYYKEDVTGLRVTPPSYPCTLEAVGLAFSNPLGFIENVEIVIYKYDGGVGDELFRKSFAYVPSGQYALPVGLTLTEGSVVVAVEKQNSSFGVGYQNLNPTTLGMVKVGGIWQEAAFTPVIGVNFRTQIAATNFDRLNNTVSVTVESPQAGTYKAEITANNIPFGPQPYALVMSGMVGDNPTEGEIELNTDQPGAPMSTFLSKAHSASSAVNVNTVYGTALESVYSDKSSFCVQTVADSVISIRYSVTGLPTVEAKELTLAKLFTNGTNKQFKYANLEDYTDGNWWLTDVLGKFVEPVQALNSTTAYYVVSVLKDNGSYDDNPDLGVIDDPQILGMSSPDTGGTGCTVGMDNEYGPILLMLIAILSLVLGRFSKLNSGEPFITVKFRK
ncbi:Subtilase family protein [Maridesulfovibrio ferrireducens]|uniref:Subtilase family protein n=1 Tax=Maridesulfovibrio ferrireducens TaxID=246191 RepID=A0A1G9FWY1_9BACT|nr:S8 family serine peptidase [Maridesulfovibrio ferrireducens]SDK92858.1 Subtilase family protein [Maridesulfovibrio ferrireducens]